MYLAWGLLILAFHRTGQCRGANKNGGLVAAIPAVIIYNVFARSIASYKAQVADASAQVLLLVSRDLDMPTSTERNTAPQMVRAV